MRLNHRHAQRSFPLFARFGPRLLAAACALGLGTGCASEQNDSGGNSAGKRMYTRELCSSCHGFERKGSWMGPPLTGLSQHWQRDKLADFIGDPSQFTAKDERLRQLGQRFQARMVGNTRLGYEERLKLADWLLEQSK